MKKSVIKLLGGVLFCACLVFSLLACGGESSGDKQELDYTKGLVFEKVGEEYAVTGYTGIDTEVKIPANYKSLPVTSIAENAFFANTRIKQVKIGENVKTIGKKAFQSCSDLANINIPDSVESIGESAFASCTGARTLHFGDGLKNIDNGAFFNCTSFKEAHIPSGVETIGPRAFWNCDKMERCEIPESVVTIGSQAIAGADHLVIYCERAFRPYTWDSSWRDSHFVVWNSKTNNVAEDGYIYTKSGDLFYAIWNQEARVVINLNDDNTAQVIPDSIRYNNADYAVTEVAQGVFDRNENITSLTVGTNLKNITQYSFRSCINLKEVTINAEETTVGRQTFAYCEKLEKVTFTGKSLTIASEAFTGCQELKEVVGSGIKSVGSSAFAYCGKLENVDLSQVVGYSVLDKNAFDSCVSLKNVTLSEGLKTIGSKAFVNCTSLTKIIIPSTVSEMDDKVFDECTALTIYCRSESTPESGYGYWEPNWSGSCQVIWGYDGE